MNVLIGFAIKLGLSALVYGLLHVFILTLPARLLTRLSHHLFKTSVPLLQKLSDFLNTLSVWYIYYIVLGWTAYVAVLSKAYIVSAGGVGWWYYFGVGLFFLYLPMGFVAKKDIWEGSLASLVTFIMMGFIFAFFVEFHRLAYYPYGWVFKLIFKSELPF